MQSGIYARISQDVDGTQLGVGRQEEDCRREAERRGWDVAEVYVDNDVSATRARIRPSYQRMLRDIESSRISALVVWDVDRLTRTPRELEDLIDLADRYGLALANVGGDIDLSTPDGRMMARIKGTLARREVEQMSKRLKRRFLQKAELGEPHGYSPFGFTREDRRDLVNPMQAEVVREAARRVLALESLRAIVTDFNIRGIHGPKAPLWNSTILRQILVRPTNAGLRQYQGKVIGESLSESIYDQDTHDRLVALLTDPSRRSNNVGPGFKYLLSGIAICGRCGGVMRRQIGRTTVSKRTGATKRQPPSYNCSACFRVRRVQADVDTLVTAVIVDRLSREDIADLFPKGNASQAREAQATLQAIDAKLDLIADQFSEDTITAAQLKRMTARLRLDRTASERALKLAQPNEILRSLTGGDVARKWELIPIAAQREAIDLLITVTVMPSGSGQRFDPNHVVIKWRSEPVT